MVEIMLRASTEPLKRMFLGDCCCFHCSSLIDLTPARVVLGVCESISCQLTWGPQLASSSCWAFSAITVHTMWTQTVSLARSATQGKTPVLFPSRSVYHTLYWICECVQRRDAPLAFMFQSEVPAILPKTRDIKVIYFNRRASGWRQFFHFNCRVTPAVSRRALPNRQPRPVQHQWL